MLAVVAALATLIFINVLIANLRIQGQALPEYAPWTGIAPLEQKVRMLHQFASEGPVDAVIIGSSISDHGLSAAVLSRDLSLAYGRPFRVFNLSTGGAESSTLLLLYRLAHSLANPRQVWICFPVERNTAEHYDLNPGAPDYALRRAPVGTALRLPWLLPAMFRFFQVPLVRNAGALHDAAVYGSFVKRPITLLDLYGLNSSGDTRGFLHSWGTESFEKYVSDRRETVVSLAKDYAAAGPGRPRAETYFSRSAIHAYEEIRMLAASDHCRIMILAHDTASGWSIRDSEYAAAGGVFYKVMSNLLMAPVIDVRGAFALAGYDFADPVHFNSIGADEISTMMAAKISGRLLPRLANYASAPEVRDFLPVSNVTPLTAVVVQKDSDPGGQLHLTYMQSLGVPPLLPGAPIQLVVLLPDARALSLPARIVSRGRVLAETANLPRHAGGQAILVQVTTRGASWGLGMSVPLFSYRWSGPVPSSLKNDSNRTASSRQ